jgi:hypothetical protein
LGQAFTHVEAYIIDSSINLIVISALIDILETAFGDPNHISAAECKLEALKQTKHDFSTSYAVFQ